MKTNPNEPASPVEVSIVDGNIIGNQTSQFSYFATGLTKREHFAGLAMQGLCAWGANDFNFDHVERIAKISIAQADALIEELNKTER